MVGNAAGLAGVSGAQVRTAEAQPWDRFANWQIRPARLLLLAMLLMLIASVMVPITTGRAPVKAPEVSADTDAPRKRDPDLALYDRIIARVGNGENYYAVVGEEHRRGNYPVTPGLAVRLPTLAFIAAWLGETGQKAAAVLLLLGVVAVWWRRLGEEPGVAHRRAIAIALLIIGTWMGYARQLYVLHEFWAGMLLALSFGLHRPGKWVASFAAAALALAIREHALPFVLLMAAMAFWRGDRKEGAAWSALAILFLGMLLVHLQLAATLVQPGDRESPSWMAFRGLSGWLSNVVLSTVVTVLPHWLAGPVALLAIFGWAGWRTPTGNFATFLFLGYGLLFMIAGRGSNFYWGMIIVPAMYVGLAFVPDWARSLWRAARFA
jgi:hypothetical protein